MNVHTNWRTYSGDESSESCSEMKAMEFRMSLGAARQGELTSRGSWRNLPPVLVPIYTFPPHQAYRTVDYSLSQT